MSDCSISPTLKPNGPRPPLQTTTPSLSTELPQMNAVRENEFDTGA
jgi:hypothetical protein